MLQHKLFLPTAGVNTPLKAYDWDGHNLRVQQDVEPFPADAEPVVVGVNSFGIGGSYGHAILEEYRGPAVPVAAATAGSSFPRLLSSLSTASSSSSAALVRRGSSRGGSSSGVWEEPNEAHLLALSAASLPHLQLYAQRLAAFLRAQAAAVGGEQESASEQSQALLRDLCATLWCHRSRFAYRRAFQATTPLDLAAQLEAFAKGSGDGVKPAGEGRKMQACFVFTGQGSQYPGVGSALMRFPVYRQAVEAVDEQFRALAGWSILEKLGSLSAAELKETQYAQPASFLVQVRALGLAWLGLAGLGFESLGGCL
jgi:acyl transferase domain-containing protein